MACGELPELAMVDLRLLSSFSGIEMGERLRKSSVLREMAVVISTAY